MRRRQQQAQQQLQQQQQQQAAARQQASSAQQQGPGRPAAAAAAAQPQPQAQRTATAAQRPASQTPATMAATSNVPPTSRVQAGPDDKYGLLGLLNVIRMTDMDLNHLVLGQDLTSLGLNLNSTECLYATFGSPWGGSELAGNLEPEYVLPACYYERESTFKQAHLARYSLKTVRPHSPRPLPPWPSRLSSGSRLLLSSNLNLGLGRLTSRGLVRSCSTCFGRCRATRCKSTPQRSFTSAAGATTPPRRSGSRKSLASSSSSTRMLGTGSRTRREWIRGS